MDISSQNAGITTVVASQDSAGELARARADGLNVDTPPELNGQAQPQQAQPQAQPQDQSNVTSEQVQAMAMKYGNDPARMAEALAHAQALISRQQAQPQAQPTDRNQPLQIQPNAPETGLQGIDLGALSREIVENHGELTKESRAALIKRGIPEEIVDTHVQGVIALAQLQRGAIVDTFGGEQNWQAIQAWARTNAPDEVVAEFNNAMQTQDATRQRAAARHLRTMYETSSSGQPTLVEGALAGRGSAAGYQSKEEVLSAMNDPKYQRGDERYINEVTAKLAQTPPEFW